MADRDQTAVLRLVEQLQPALQGPDRRKLTEIIGQLVALRAPMGSQWQSLARIAGTIGEHRLSRGAIDLFVEACEDSPAAQFQKATLLAEAGLLEEADALLRSLPENVPDPVSYAYTRGVTALNLGKRDEARGLLESVTRHRPDVGAAWLMLAMSADMAHEPSLAGRIVAAEARAASAAPPQQAAYWYARGKVHADCGDHPAAFAGYARGAQLMKAVASYDREKDRAEAAEALRDYSAGRIEAIARRQSEPTGRAIFATGLPRSGTTLVQQILTGHSAVSDGAEMGGLALLALDVGGRSCSALERYIASQGSATAARLWSRLLEERFPAPGRVVDKAIDSTRFLGIAAALLPDAPLIWMTRDPLDRAWSCFRTNFLGGAIPWSYDLRDIAAHFRIEDELLMQWQHILGERLLVVPYESLVSEPAAWVPRILAHCGLDMEAQVLAPHENRQAVTTASMVQVRRPIHRDAVGSSAPYRPFLEDFLEAYRL